MDVQPPDVTMAIDRCMLDMRAAARQPCAGLCEIAKCQGGAGAVHAGRKTQQSIADKAPVMLDRDPVVLLMIQLQHFGKHDAGSG